MATSSTQEPPQNKKCPICELEKPTISYADLSSSDRAEVICRRCGTFAVKAIRPLEDIRPTPAVLLEKGVPRADVQQAMKLFRAYLSIYTREYTESGRTTEALDFWDTERLVRLAETYAYTPVPAKLDKLLRLIERRSAFPGSLAEFDPSLDYPAVHAVVPEDLRITSSR